MFDQNDNNDDICEEIRYLFNENGLEYEETKKLMSVKAKKEYVSVIHSIIEQKEVIDYDVNYYRANYRRCEKVQEIDHIKYKAFLVKESSDYTFDYEPIKCFELVNDQKAEFCKIIEEQKVECCELINDQKVECCELIEGPKVEFCK